MFDIKDRKEIVIVCPNCGREYLPAEVFVPSAFFGKPEDIDRTPAGKIDIYDGEPMCLTEEYRCDGCNTVFEVTADVRFKTKAKQKEEFSTVYTSHISKKISLFEDIDSDNNK